MSETSISEADGAALIFEAGGRRLALPLVDVVEIIRPIAITRVPHSRPELLGIANFRGVAIPVVSAPALLGAAEPKASNAERIVILKRNGVLGLMVDEVLALAKTPDTEVMDLDGLLTKSFPAQAPRSRKLETKLRSSAGANDEGDRNERAFLAFALADQEFALAIDQSDGVALLPASIARVPRTDQAMIGAAEIQGGLVPLVSLRHLLGFPPGDLDAKTSRVVLVWLAETRVGVIVDRVNEILRISPDALDPVPKVLTRAKGEAQIEAIVRLDDGRRLVSLLEPTKLFDAETASRIAAETGHGNSNMTKDEETVDGEQFIVFQLGDQSYGLAIVSVDEVVRCPDKLTRVPRAPAFVSGLMNLRGQAVPVIDQGQRFAASQASQGDRGRIVVVTIEGFKAGFLVDRVSEILTVSADDLSPAPELASDGTSVIDRVAMIEREGHMILLVDPKALLNQAERDILHNMSTTSEPAGL